VEKGRIPERVQLLRNDQEQGSQRGLVKRRQDHAHDHQRHADSPNDPTGPFEVESVEDDRRELHGAVEHDAQAALEHNRARVPHHEGVPDPMRLAQVEKQRQDDEDIPEERGEAVGRMIGAKRFRLKIQTQTKGSPESMRTEAVDLFQVATSQEQALGGSDEPRVGLPINWSRPPWVVTAVGHTLAPARRRSARGA